MNQCIYYSDGEDLHFTTEEHIIPAGIGGVKKLSKGVVSDEFNNDFSKLEQDFIRKSLIAIPREFYGPGKRGSLSPSKASQSQVHVMFSHEEENDPNLGFMELGKPYMINQIKVKETIVSLTLRPSEESVEDILNKFKDDLINYDNNPIEIIDDQLEEDTVLLGIHKKKWYLARHKAKNISNLKSVVAMVVNDFQRATEKNAYQVKKNKITSSQSLTIHVEDTFRVYAKIAFNALTFLTNKEFVSKESFNEIRNWIANGGENRFVHLLNNNGPELSFDYLNFPTNSHRIILTKIDSCLFAIVSLYGHAMSTGVKIATDFNEPFNLRMFICDWENKVEYNMPEYLQMINKKTNEN